MASLSDDQLREQVDLLMRGAEALYTEQDLTERLKASAETGKPLRVKLGMDPTAPDIHLGHSVVLRKMRQFQDLGHKAVLIIGDYTARIGDPSGVNKTRPVLSGDDIDRNAKTYFDQAGKILDTSPAKLEVRPNGEWLKDLSFADVLRLASQMTVARMMERDTFEQRFKAGEPIGVHEFLYPLMQGYDSVCVEADVELGGTDQTFNNLVGRGMQEKAGQKPQIVLIMPILVGLDGTEKMSKSKGNYIGITDQPNDMFGKVMSIPDDLMANYYTLLTAVPADEVAALCDGEQTHPRQAKAKLGQLIVEQYYGAEAAQAAEAEFSRVFSEGNKPTDMPEIAIPADGIKLVDLMVSAGFAKSKGEARRLIGQNAVSIDDVKIADVEADVTADSGDVLKVGKRRFGKLVNE